MDLLKDRQAELIRAAENARLVDESRAVKRESLLQERQTRVPVFLQSIRRKPEVMEE
jgi:hypothetical protein